MHNVSVIVFVFVIMFTIYILTDSSSIDGSSEASDSPASVRKRKNLSLVSIKSSKREFLYKFAKHAFTLNNYLCHFDMAMLYKRYFFKEILNQYTNLFDIGLSVK